MKKVVLLAVLMMAITSGLYAQETLKIVTSDKTGWHKIGEATVNFNTDRDDITVNGADKFAAIKFRVKDEPIYLTSLEAYFDDGNKQNINVNFPIKPQGESRVIEFEGGERDLKKIVFVYKTIANRKDLQAHVELWGLKTNDDKR